MAKKEKLLERARSNPKNWSLHDALSLLGKYKFLKQSQRGSHASFIHRDFDVEVSMPVRRRKKNEVLPCYIEAIVDAIDEVEKLSGGKT